MKNMKPPWGRPPHCTTRGHCTPRWADDGAARFGGEPWRGGRMGDGLRTGTGALTFLEASTQGCGQQTGLGQG